jgi:hypothetical protein
MARSIAAVFERPGTLSINARTFSNTVQSQRDNAGGESLTDHRRRAVGRFESGLRRHQARSALGRARHRDGKSIEQQ